LVGLPPAACAVGLDPSKASFWSRSLRRDLVINAQFVWLISHQPTVVFSQNKPATSNQPAVLSSHNKSAPAISNQPKEQAANWAKHAYMVQTYSK
jgi:hypothetical protein